MDRSRIVVVAAVLALALAGCGGGEDEDSGETAASTTETTETTTDTGAAPARGDDPIPFELVERLAPEHLSKDPECPAPGRWTPSRETLTTITEEAARAAKTPPQSYGCGGRIDQVIWAEFEDPADAQELLDPTNNSNAVALVSGGTVVLVNLGVEEKVDIKAFFDEIQEECDCGETRYTGAQ